MSNLDRLFEATRHLRVDAHQKAHNHVLGYLSGHVTPEVMDRAIASALAFYDKEAS